MYERQTSSTAYKIPQCCCKCLGPPEKRLMIVQAKEWTEEGVKYRQSYDIDVPICSSCKKGVYKRRLVGFGLFLAAAAAAWLLWQQDWDNWEIWSAIVVVVAGLIALGYFWFSRLPADIEDNGLPIFRNADYQKRFEELNGISPSRYAHYEFVESREKDDGVVVQESRQAQTPAYEPLFEFGSGTSILKFPAGTEDRYARHVRLIEHLVAAGVFPTASVCGLKASSNASSARLILVTGSTEALRDLSKSYYGPQAEAFVNNEFGGDWAAISAASTLSNVSEPGMAVGDLGPFVELCQEIEGGAYHLDRVITKV